MPVLIVIIGVIMLLLLITVGKINASISFVIVSLFVGLSMGLSLDDTVEALFKEYFNLTLKETLATRTVMETIIGVVGLAGVMLLNIFI